MEPNATYHTSVLLHEAIEGLSIVPDGIYVDATFGGGGHSRAILSLLGAGGRLIAFDQDADAWANAPADDRLTRVPENFRHLSRFLRFHGIPLVNGILADLGVSSHQFDTGDRGFSIKHDGPNDMRMDLRMPRTAADVLMQSSEAQLHLMFQTYGEVRNARQLAHHIVTNRSKSMLATVGSFKTLIQPVVKGLPNRYLAQVFQALRIEVNDEMGALKDLLTQSASMLAPGGRLVVITFHSGEDRLVKQFIKKGNWDVEGEDLDPYGRKPILGQLRPINTKPIEPSEAELVHNPRARSAKLRIAEKAIA